MSIELHFRRVGQQKLVVRPRIGVLYLPTERVREACLEAEWAEWQLMQPEVLLNKARNMTNHELAREVLERVDDYLDGDGLAHARWVA